MTIKYFKTKLEKGFNPSNITYIDVQGVMPKDTIYIEMTSGNQPLKIVEYFNNDIVKKVSLDSEEAEQYTNKNIFIKYDSEINVGISSFFQYFENKRIQEEKENRKIKIDGGFFLANEKNEFLFKNNKFNLEDGYLTSWSYFFKDMEESERPDPIVFNNSQEDIDKIKSIISAIVNKRYELFNNNN